MGSVCMFRYGVFLKQGDDANGCMLELNVFPGEEEDRGEEVDSVLHSDRVATSELKQKPSIHEG